MRAEKQLITGRKKGRAERARSKQPLQEPEKALQTAGREAMATEKPKVL